MEKSGRKSGRKPGTFTGADDPRRGRGPQPGAPNAGRPPDAFRELCRQLASGETTVGEIRAVLKDRTHPQFMAALKWATEHGYGKPTEHVEHSGTVNHKHQIWKFGDREVAF